MRRPRVLPATLLLAALCLLYLAARPTTPRIAFAATTPTLRHPDTACRQCHQEIYDAYQQTPMARGSGLAADGLTPAELHARDLTHAPSGITYHVALSDGQPTLSYTRPATPARSALAGTFDLRYFIGSGKRARTFLYQRDDLWFEVPINWYGKQQLWDMAPAFGSATTMPGPLPTDPNCLHCHAGQVQPSLPGARNRFAVAPFLAAGIGCAACHGDPSLHLAQAAAGHIAPNSILNPDRLSPARRDSACLQCHLEGDAAISLPGKSLATFVPGDDLSATTLYFVDRNRAQQGLRASSQYEALLRSACKRATGDKLTCTSCHDPHSSPAPADRVAFFRSRCLACHTSPALATTHHPEQPDCATCHMPTRNTADISHEQLTDHDVEARPAAILRSLARLHAPDLVPVGAAPFTDRELGLAYAQLAQHGDQVSGERALKLLQQAELAGSTDTEVRNQLGFLLQVSGSASSAAAQYTAALHQSPHDATAAANLAVLAARSGQTPAALQLLHQVFTDDPSQTAAGLNLAFLTCRTGRKAEAREILRRILTFNPDSPATHQFLDSGTYGNQTCPLN